MEEARLMLGKGA